MKKCKIKCFFFHVGLPFSCRNTQKKVLFCCQYVFRELSYASQAGEGCGGAIFSAGGVLAACNIEVVNNMAIGGAAIELESSDGVVIGGSALGGALYSTGGTITISNGFFSNNAATGAFGKIGPGGVSQGGSVFNSGSILFWDCQIESSQAEGASGGYENGESLASAGMGGAIYNSGTMQMDGSTIVNSSANAGPASFSPGAGGLGGAIYSTGTVQIVGLTVSNSSANAGIAYYSSAPAQGLGGAIYNTGTMQIAGLAVSRSSANGGSTYFGEPGGDGLGGAIYNTGYLSIGSAVLTGNTAAGGSTSFPPGSGWGGAIANRGFLQLFSTLLSSNVTAGQNNNGEQIFSSGLIQSDTNSVVTPYVTGTPPLAYQWQANGTNISGATNSIFNLGNVQFANAGTYELVISNATGLVTNFEEIVNQPPPPLTISSVTPNVGLTNGGTSVRITGTGFLDGATLSFGNAAATSVIVVSSTSITAVTPPASAMGAVNVVVTNGDFQQLVVSNGFTYEAPILVSIPPQSAFMGAGSNATFTMNVGGAGMTGFNFVIESSTNLVNWQTRQTNSSPFTFTDTNAGSFPLRFYRAVLVP